jgi:hypothetical protein
MADTETKKPQQQKSRQERLIGALDSWQKVVLAITALVLALGGLIAAGIKVSQTVRQGVSSVANHSSNPTDARPLDGSARSAASGSSPATTATAVPTSGAEIGSDPNFSLPDEDSLNYTSAAGNQTLLTFFAELGELTAGPNVNLAVLDPPAPAAHAAYNACENDGNFTMEITLDTLAPGSTLCAVTPNSQVVWIRFLPTDSNSQSSALHLATITWQGPTG